MTFSKGRNPNNQSFKFDGEIIENVTSFNYLGIIFNRTGSFNDAKSHNFKKSNNCYV